MHVAVIILVNGLCPCLMDCGLEKAPLEMASPGSWIKDGAVLPNNTLDSLLSRAFGSCLAVATLAGPATYRDLKDMSKARDEPPAAFECPNAILTSLLMLQLLECAGLILFD